MRTLDSLKSLAKKVTGKTKIPGNTADEVIQYINDNLKIAEAVTAYGLVLQSPDESVWDVKIDNAGTLSATKRT